MKMKRRTKRRVISLLTSAVLLISTVSPAFAVDLSTNTNALSGEIMQEEEAVQESVSDNTDIVMDTASPGAAISAMGITAEDTVSDDAVSKNAVSRNSISQNKLNIHAAQFSGVEPKIQQLDDGTFVAVKGQKIFVGAGGQTSNKKIISIDKKGTAKAKKAGKATITYPDGQALEVNVIDMKASMKSLKLSVGDSVSVSINAGGLENKGLKVAYQASKPNVVQLNDGNVVAVAKGSVKVTATVGGKTFSTNVKVSDKEGSTLVLDAYIGAKGTKVPVKGAGNFTVASCDNATTASDDGNTANKGMSAKQGLRVVKNKLTGYEKGKYTISGNGREIVAYVDDSQPTNPSRTLLVGQPVLVDVPEHSFIKWKSKNPLVAAVSEYGYIIGVSAGSTEVFGFVNGKKMSAFNIDVSEGEYKQPDLVSYTHEITLVDPVNNNKEVKLWFDDFGHYTKNQGQMEEANRPVITPDPEPDPEPEPEPKPQPDPEPDYTKMSNKVNFMAPDGNIFRTISVVSGNLIAAADIPAIGEMPETDTEKGNSVGYNPNEWYKDQACRKKFDFATPITVPSTNLYPKYGHYNRVAFALTTATNAEEAPADIEEADPRFIEREGRVYENETINNSSCGIPTGNDFDAFLFSTGFSRYWAFDKWLKSPVNAEVTHDTLFTAAMKGTEHQDGQGLIFKIHPHDLDTLNDDTASLVGVSDETALKANERIDIPEDIQGVPVGRDEAKTFLDNILDEDHDTPANVYDNGWYYFDYSYYKHHDENDLRYVVNKQSNAVVLRADEENCINNRNRHYYHIENAQHKAELGSHNLIDTDRSESAYLTPQLTNLGYVVVDKIADIRVFGNVYEPTTGDDNTDFFLDRSKHTDAYRKVYKDKKTGFIFYIDDGEDPDSEEDDVAVIVINPGNGGNDKPDEIPGEVEIPGEPPQSKPTGGITTPGEPPVIKTVGRENGWIYALGDGKSEILAFENTKVSLATQTYKVADWNADEFYETFGVSEDIIPRNAIWVGDAEHKPVLGGGEVLNEPSETNITNIMTVSGQPVVTNKEYITKDTVWYLHPGYCEHPIPDDASGVVMDGREADVYNRVYKDASGYLFIIDDPTEDTEPNPHDDDRAIIVGFDDPEGNPEIIVRPTSVIDPRDESGQLTIPVVDEPGTDPSGKKPGSDPTDHYWVDPDDPTGTKHLRHYDGDIMFIKTDADRDDIYDSAVVIGILPPSSEDGAVVPAQLTDENGDQFDTVKIHEDATNDLDPSATLNVKSNKEPGAGVSPASVFGNLVFEGTADDGTYIYRRFGIEGDVVYVVPVKDQPAKVIGASSDRFRNRQAVINVPAASTMKVSDNNIVIEIGRDFTNSFFISDPEAEQKYQCEPGEYYLDPDIPWFYNNLGAADIHLMDANEGTLHAPRHNNRSDRAPSDIGLYDGEKTEKDYYWKLIGDNTYRQIHKLGQFYVAYADDDMRTILGWYGLSYAGKNKGAELIFDCALLNEKDTTKYNQGMIADEIFTNNPTAMFSFCYTGRSSQLSDSEIQRLLGVNFERTIGADTISFVNIYNKNDRRTYVRTLADDIYEYVLTWDEKANLIKAMITGLTDPSHNKLANTDPELDGLSMYQQIKIPATIGGYPVSSVNDNALVKANDGKNVSEIKSDVPLGKDVIADTGVQYDIPDSLASEGISGKYTDGAGSGADKTYSQTYKTRLFSIKDGDRNSTNEAISYTFKYIHEKKQDDNLHFTGADTSAEKYAILTGINFDRFATQGKEGTSCYITMPKYVPDGTNDGALVIAVDENVRSQIQRMKTNSGRDIRFDTPLPTPELPSWVNSETGEVIIEAKVTILVQGENAERAGVGFSPINELDMEVQNSPDPSLDGKPGFCKEFKSSQGDSILNDDATKNSEMDKILYKDSYRDLSDPLNTTMMSAKELGFVNPRLYEMEKRDDGTYRSTGKTLSVSGNTAVEGDSVYELRFERDTYRITEIVTIVDEDDGSTQVIEMGTFNVKNGADLSHLGTSNNGRKEYRTLQWYSDPQMTTRFENTEVTSSNPAAAADGTRCIYGRLGGSRYEITLEACDNSIKDLGQSSPAAVEWSLNDKANNTWQQTDFAGTWGKPVGQSNPNYLPVGQNPTRTVTLYGYYQAKLGYYYDKVLGKGTGKILPGLASDGSVISDDKPTMDNYEFKGWYTKNGAPVTADTMLTKGADADDGVLASPSQNGVTFYAKWEGKKSQVTLNKNGGTGGTSTVTATYGSAMPAVTAPTRTGYTYKGYYTGSSSNGDQYYKADGTSAQVYNKNTSATLYAGWKVNTYTIKYNYNCPSGATNKGGTTSNQTKTYGTNLALRSNGFAVPTQTGYTYTFSKWNTKADGTGTSYNAGATMSTDHASAQGATVNLYAIWKKTANNYKLTYNANGGSVSPASKTVKFNTTYGTLPTPSRSNTGGGSNDSSETRYIFQGWFTSASGGSQVSSSTKMTTTGATIYAHWKTETRTRTWYSAYEGYYPDQIKVQPTVIVNSTYHNFSWNTVTKGVYCVMTSTDNKVTCGVSYSSDGSISLTPSKGSALIDLDNGNGTISLNVTKANKVGAYSAHWGDWSGWS